MLSGEDHFIKTILVTCGIAALSPRGVSLAMC